VLSQLKIVIRTNYSNPPTHGGAVVAAVLGNPELRALWEKELGEMRVRIKAMRQKLVDGLKAAGVQQDMSFITTPDRHVQLLGPVQGPDGAPAQRVRRVRHRHRPHVRGRAQQQEHRLRLPGSIAKVVEINKPFCELRRFKRFSDDTATLDKLKDQPAVLIVAPLSGHYATLLRDTVKTMLKDHKVYITDWKNARLVPCPRRFHLDDYVNYVQEFIRHLQGSTATAM
jgi:hypothetical protein